MGGGWCTGEECTGGRVSWGRAGAEDVEDVRHVVLGRRFFAVAHHEVRYLEDDGVLALVFEVVRREGEGGEREFVARSFFCFYFC